MLNRLNNLRGQARSRFDFKKEAKHESQVHKKHFWRQEARKYREEVDAGLSQNDRIESN